MVDLLAAKTKPVLHARLDLAAVGVGQLLEVAGRYRFTGTRNTDLIQQQRTVERVVALVRHPEAQGTRDR